MPAIYGDEDRLNIAPYVVRFSPANIPDTDINEEPLHCMSINEKWVPHFIGIIHALEQLDTWKGTFDERENAVRQVESAALQLVRLCEPCADCAECSDNQGNGEDGTNGNGCGGNDESCGDDMGQVVTDVSLDEKGNIVVHFGPCCEKTLIGLVQSRNDAGHSTDTPPIVKKPDETAIKDWQCAKAEALGMFWDAVINAVNDHTGGLPNTFVNYVKDNINECDWSTSSLAKIYWYKQEIDLDPLSSTAWNSDDTSNIIARWASILDTNTTEISNAEFAAMKDQMRSYLGGSGSSGGTVMTTIMDFITHNRFQQAVNNSDLLGEHDCQPAPYVPGEDEIPSGVYHTWQAIFDFKTGNYGFEQFGNGGAEYEVGVGWVYDNTEFNSARLPKVRRQGKAGAEPTKLTYAKVHILGWPLAGQGQTVGDYWFFFQYDDQGIYGTNWIGQEWPTGYWQNPGGKSPSVWLNATVSDMWWPADQNVGYKMIIDKIILAGFDDDFWSKLQPDGTWST